MFCWFNFSFTPHQSGVPEHSPGLHGFVSSPKLRRGDSRLQNFFVNGRNLRGAVPYENFEDLVIEELAKAKKTCAGMAGDACYSQKIIANGKVFEPLESKVTEFNNDGRPFLGAKDGDVVIAEFSDFQ